MTAIKGLVYIATLVATTSLSGCSGGESRTDAPEINGLYRCALQSTENMDSIPAGSRYFRYFNINTNGESQRSVIYFPAPLTTEVRTSIQWINMSFHVEDRVGSPLDGRIKAWDGSKFCFLINPGQSNPALLSEIDGKLACALSLDPTSGVYRSAIMALPETGVCQRLTTDQ